MHWRQPAATAQESGPPPRPHRHPPSTPPDGWLCRLELHRHRAPADPGEDPAAVQPIAPPDPEHTSAPRHSRATDADLRLSSTPGVHQDNRRSQPLQCPSHPAARPPAQGSNADDSPADRGGAPGCKPWPPAQPGPDHTTATGTDSARSAATGPAPAMLRDPGVVAGPLQRHGLAGLSAAGRSQQAPTAPAFPAWPAPHWC